jgi:radical SAM/Cys-rich protein
MTTDALPIIGPHSPVSFDQQLEQYGLPLLRRDVITSVQVNVGKLCNQACHHCHVDAGPKRTERMSAEVARRTIELVAATPSVNTVDITGGAPELNPNFRTLVLESRQLGLKIIDRCNLTVLFEDGQQDLGEFLAANSVEITASLPCYTESNVDAQRGRGVFNQSIAALRRLNQLGYGAEGSALVLNLVYNPLGPSIPPSQERLEADYKRHLADEYGINFNRLFAITNMPIKRFASELARKGKAEAYMSMLVNHFNPQTVSTLMCRSMISVSWDGRLFDCDFNQMLDIESSRGKDMFEVDSFSAMNGTAISTASHCFGCTAGAGSSCQGSLS